MRRMRIGPTVVDGRHERRLRHVGDVEDEKTMMPVRHVQPIAMAQRMVTARLYVIVPRVRLASGDMLPWYPPATDFLRRLGIGEVEDHHDVADVAFRRWRDVGVAAIEREAMHAAAFAGDAPFVDEPRLRWRRHVEDADTAAEFGCAFAEFLVVDHHQVAGHAHLVRMPADRNVELRDELRMLRVRDIVDRRAVRRPHVRYVKNVPVPPDLSASRTVDVA